MEIRFTRHALEKLEQRGIPRERVYATLNNPQKILVVGEKFYAFRKFGKIYLRVIFVRDREETVILTQHYIRSLP